MHNAKLEKKLSWRFYILSLNLICIQLTVLLSVTLSYVSSGAVDAWSGGCKCNNVSLAQTCLFLIWIVSKVVWNLVTLVISQKYLTNNSKSLKISVVTLFETENMLYRLFKHLHELKIIIIRSYLYLTNCWLCDLNFLVCKTVIK